MAAVEKANRKPLRRQSAYSCRMQGCNTFAGVNFSSRLVAVLRAAPVEVRSAAIAAVHRTLFYKIEGADRSVIFLLQSSHRNILISRQRTFAGE
jgi:hypothetical protein